MIKDYGGVINQLVAGEWKHPHTGQTVPIDIRSIVIKETLAGMEGHLIASLHKGLPSKRLFGKSLTPTLRRSRN
jgi:hypothetical protein